MRSRNGIHAGSKLDILAAEGDLYVAKIDDKVIVKIGSRYDVGNLIPSDFHPIAHGNNYCIWEKSGLRVPTGGTTRPIRIPKRHSFFSGLLVLGKEI